MMSPSDGGEVSECVHGCRARDVHFATCSVYDVVPDPSTPRCRGCAPAPVVEGLLVCDGCRRQVKWLLRNAGDLLGRMSSLLDQGKAVAYSPAKVPTLALGPRDDSDLRDARRDLLAQLGRWDRWIDPRTLHGLDVVLADWDLIGPFLDDVLEVHVADEDGYRHWSVKDAVDRWGVERRDRHVYDGPLYDETRELFAQPVTEYSDPLLTTKDAAARAEVSQSQLRRWVQAGQLAPVARLRDGAGHVSRWFRASEVDAAAALMRSRRHAGVALPPE